MSDRPTPEEIIRKWGVEAAEVLDQFDDPSEIAARLCIVDLAEYGYRIVHPDDVPERENDWGVGMARAYNGGWNACRAHIFGERR